MEKYFEVKVAYVRAGDDGMMTAVKEVYLVQAVNFGDAEKRTAEYIAPYTQGELEVTDIRRAKFSEVYPSDDTNDDKWYKCKLEFVTLDESSGREKRSSYVCLVQSSSLSKAVEAVSKLMEDSMIDYSQVGIQETPIMDYVPYAV